ncbi:hypothetical protein F4778DRAFT_356579 [Xylariomycetidae sp. FL2044]|nr:hypothetical protein F4778DRAFT_356579 [Xylariomycetidae sp. FL2044]
MGHSKSFSTAAQDDDFEFDEAYFRQFYKPLSNLPTPPPSSRTSSAPQSPLLDGQDDYMHDAQFLGPAAHLTRMLPPGASFITPSVPLVQSILGRANLPMDTIALAACILDSLNSRFSRTWRVSFPLHRQGEPAPKRHTLPSGSVWATHIDAVSPEVIILAALIIAEKFVEDAQQSNQFFGSAWGRDLWTCEQLNFTERCIMENLGYHILPLWEEATIKQARHDIESTRRELVREESGRVGGGGGNGGVKGSSSKHFKSMSSGHAVLGLGLQMTPAQTPRSEVSTPFGHLDVGDETREAFGGGHHARVVVPLHLPHEATMPR